MSAIDSNNQGNVASRNIASRDVASRAIASRDIASRNVASRDIRPRDTSVRATNRPDIPDTALDTDALIRRLAARFHGVVSRSDLIAAGVPTHAIAYRLKRRRLHLLFDGVYRVGPVATLRELEAAALLVCRPRHGDDAGGVLSHATAARLWSFPQMRQVPDEFIDVTVGRYRRSCVGLRIHRVTSLHADDVTSLDRLTITTPARTIVDMAASIDGRTLEQMVAYAEREGLSDRSQILATIERMSQRSGAARLRALFAMETGPALTRSDAEARFLALIRRGRLPPPQTNARVIGFEVDVLWRAEKLIVEVDGFAYHSSRHAFERDRARDSDLTARGYHVMRVTWKQLQDEPEAVLARVALALGRARTPAP